jgi:2-amino-4-hydroxy-6-hydroxymethyldihydropteridine diphosphokinase
LLDVVVGLGSNLGDRLGHLHAAVASIDLEFGVTAWSAIYETAPVGPAQPDYLNAAVRVATLRSPREILEILLGIERAGGRVRTSGTRWAARTIDLDILWIDGVVVVEPTLTVPHALLVERPFALLPLLDVAPNAIDPRTGKGFTAPKDSPEVRRTRLSLKAEPA